MTISPTRALIVCILLLTLFGAFVLHGTIQPNTSENRFPGNSELASGELDTGDEVVIAGEVMFISEDRTLVVLSGYADTVVDVGTTDDASVGDDVWLYGVVEATIPSDATHAIATQRAIIRAPWEIGYMYAVSTFAGIWVFVRFVRDWTIDRSSLSFVPERGEHDG